MNVVRITIEDGKYTADATWLPGSPPVARGWSSQELAIAVLREMIRVDNRPCIKFPEEKPWGEWPEYYNVEVEVG
jgi:hypothetical protein